MCVDRLRWLRYFRLLKTISLRGRGRDRGGGGEGGGGGRVEMFSGGAQIVPLGVEIFCGGGGVFFKTIFFKTYSGIAHTNFFKTRGLKFMLFFSLRGGGGFRFFSLRGYIFRVVEIA